MNAYHAGPYYAIEVKPVGHEVVGFATRAARKAWVAQNPAMRFECRSAASGRRWAEMA